MATLLLDDFAPFAGDKDGPHAALRGLLSICAYCKRIRDELSVWQQLEVYVRDRTHAKFSHGICPACLRDHFGEEMAKRCGLG